MADEPQTPPPVEPTETEEPKKPSKNVLMVSPIGGTQTAVPRAEARQKLKAGWRSATQKELVEHKLESEYGDAASGVAAFSTGALRMLSAGYSDDAIVKIFGEKARERLAGLRQVQGAATLGGEIAGAVVGTKGVGGIGRLAAPSLMARGAALPGAVRMIGGGALEGAYGGALEAKTQAFVENRELTGEALFAGAAGGAAIGGAFGGVLHGGGFLFRKGKDKLGAAYARRSAGEAGDMATAGMKPLEAAKFRAGMADKPADPGFLVRHWADSSEAVTGAPRELLEDIASNPKTRQMVAYGADDAIAAAEREFTDIANKNVNAQGTLMRYLREYKADDFAHLVPEGGIERTLPTTRANFEAGKRNLREMWDAGQFEYGKRGEIKKAIGALDAIEQRMEKSISKHYAAGGVPNGRLINRELNIAQDNMKRLFQGRAAKLKNSARRTGDPAIMASHKRFRDFSENVRTNLEDESLWGNAARAQRDLNAGQTKHWSINQDFQKRFTTRYGRDADDIWDPGIVVDPQKAGAFIKGVTNPKNDLAHQAQKQWLESAAQTAEAAKKHLKLPPKQLAAANDLIAALGNVDDTIGRATSDAAKINAFNKLIASEGGSGVLGGAAVGGLVGGLPGAALGAITGTITKPGATIMKLAAAERMAGRMGKRFGIGGGAARAAAAEQGAGFAAQGATQDVVSSVGRNVARAGSRLQRLMPVISRAAPMVYSNLESRYRDRSEKQIKSALIAADNPEQTAEDVRGRLGALGTAMPGTADAAVQTAQRAAAYLADHAPKARERPEVLGAPAVPPSDAELERFERRRAAAVDPVRTITGGIENGTITREAVDALDYIYPQLAGKLRDSYRDMIVGMADKGESLAYQTLLNLEVLMQQPLDGLSLPMTQAAIKAVYASTEPPPQAQPRKKPAPEMARYSIREDAGITKELA